MITCPSCELQLEEGQSVCPVCSARVPVSSDAPTAGFDEIGVGEEGPVAARFVPGDLLARRFRISGLIARGGMGEVYRADDVRLRQAVALKFLPEAVAADPARRELFLNEIRLARRVSHPNICRVHELFEAEGQWFISMEYVDGETLATLLRRIGRLPYEKAVDIGRQLMLGLDAAHSQGVLHRDLKPQNVMLDTRGRVRILDFGVAATIAQAHGRSEAGTPAYMPPERKMGQHATRRSDLYSAGAIIYELLTGLRPRGAADPSGMAPAAQPASLSHLLPGIDPTVERLVMQCLDSEPSRRPPSAYRVATALPGGDRLAAAVAAGETPSPEIVAEAGGSYRLPHRTAVQLLVTTLAGAVAVLWLLRTALLSQLIPFERPPEALVERARQALTQLGYADALQHGRYGYEELGARLGWLSQQGVSAGGWVALRRLRPAVVMVWYRTRPQPMIPLTGEQVSRSDPPLLLPGMTSVVVDTEGRLCRLLVVPSEGGPGSPERSREAPNWSVLFALAGLERSRFDATEPAPRSPLRGDVRAAWEGSAPGWIQGPLRIEAAAWRGRVTYFEIKGAWPPIPAESPLGVAVAPDRGQVYQGVFTFFVVLAAVVLARRNARLGRVDYRGARRTALVVLALEMATRLLSFDEITLLVRERGLLFRAVAASLGVAAAMWVLYLAIEPHVRRYWPRHLVSWTRVLAGQWRDALVGRDVLLGAHIGMLSVLLLVVLHLAPGWMGYRYPAPLIPMLEAALSPRHFAALVFLVAGVALGIGVGMAVVFVLLRLLLRREALVVLGVILLYGFTGSDATGMPVWLDGLLRAVVFGVASAILLRAGLVSLIVAVFVHNCFAFVITSDFSGWAAGTSLVAVTLVAGVTLLGFRMAIRPRAGSPTSPALRT